MGLTLTEKLLNGHLVEGEPKRGSRVGIRIDQTLTQDATGTMAYLEFEALGVPRVKTELSVSYVDHNMIQEDFKNPDDHRYLMDVARRCGIIFSPPGNGICHQLHVERFAAPGKTLLGSDSHTPTSGGVGMLAIGAGGMDVALAMAGEPFYLTYPAVVKVHLTGQLSPFVSAKDVILEVLRRIGVKGGVGKVLEYCGPGVGTLAVPDRATIANMGAETGATSSVFPSDEVAREWLRAQGREHQFVPLEADPDGVYDQVIEIDLSRVEPLVALPHQPDNVIPVREAAGMEIQQVMFGSCTNSSLRDLEAVAYLLRDMSVHPEVDCGVSPGSRQVLHHMAKSGALESILSAGVRILEVSCGACIGMGFAPPTDGVSLRTINRNFLGRCGHKTGKVCLVSPETAAASAVEGRITDPRDFASKHSKAPFVFLQPERFHIEDRRFVMPSDDPEKVVIRRGPNIAPLPEMGPMEEVISGTALLKVGDDITTDHIMPAGAKVLPLRSNVPAISKHVFEVVDPTFPERALAAKGGFIVGGANYGQGSSREHAALAPRYLGVKGVLAKSFARIHLANLVNFGILPLVFEDPSDYQRVDQGDQLEIRSQDVVPGRAFQVLNLTKGLTIRCVTPVGEGDLEIIRAGGKLNHVRSKG